MQAPKRFLKFRHAEYLLGNIHEIRTHIVGKGSRFGSFCTENAYGTGGRTVYAHVLYGWHLGNYQQEIEVHAFSRAKRVHFF